MPHIHDLIDFAVGAYIVSPDKKMVLLVEHPRYGLWLPPGGHVELDEDTDQALLREIEEETGLDVTILHLHANFKQPDAKLLWAPAYMDIHDANPPHRHIGLNYFALAKSEDFKKSDEHTSLRWFTEAEHENPKYNLREGVVFYAQEALKAAQSWNS